MKFSLYIHLGNETMQTLADVSRAVVESIGKRSGINDVLEEDEQGRIVDANGNTVGQWFTQED